MTTFDPYLTPHWRTSALVTIDVQRDVLSGQPYGIAGTTEVLPAVARLAAAFRAAGRPVIHIVRLYRPDGANADLPRRRLLAGGARFLLPDTEGSQLAPSLAPDATPLATDVLLSGQPQRLGRAEYVVYKPRWGAFYDTPLHSLLRELGIDTVVVAGCNLPNCPRATLVEASERDYRTVLATDAVSQRTDQALAELAGIGVRLLTTDRITAAVAAADQLRLFSYGTLQQTDLQQTLFGRPLPGTPDRLPGYRRTLVEITDPAVVATSGASHHPILHATGDPTDQIPGTVYQVTEDDLAAADAYEVDDYHRAWVPLQSGTHAWVYAAAHQHTAAPDGHT
jgi:nicotinamidase-related amidase